MTIMKNIIFWDMTLCILIEDNGRFRGMYYLHLQGRRVCQVTCKQRHFAPLRLVGYFLGLFFENEMEAERSSETSVKRITWHHIPEYGSRHWYIYLWSSTELYQFPNNNIM
jgi:hypothetical protein